MEGQKSKPVTNERRREKQENPCSQREPNQVLLDTAFTSSYQLPDRFVRIVNDLIVGIRAIIPSFPTNKRTTPLDGAFV